MERGSLSSNLQLTSLKPPPVAPTVVVPRFFTLLCSGQIEAGLFPQHDHIYCKFNFVHGPDWIPLSVITFENRVNKKAYLRWLQVQKACRLWPKKGTRVFGTFQSRWHSNPQTRWPQLVVSVYGLDSFGRDVIRGYGSVRLPTSAGRHVKYIPMFAPVATSPFHDFYAWMLGQLPEFVDPLFPSKQSGREVTRVKSQGLVKVEFNIATREMDTFGYQSDPVSALKMTLMR